MLSVWGKLIKKNSNPHLPNELLLVNEIETVGRGPGSSLLVSKTEDVHISKQHFKITKRDDEFFVGNLSDSTGTLLNGILVSVERKLSDGDLISICNGKKRLRSSRQTQTKAWRQKVLEDAKDTFVYEFTCSNPSKPIHIYDLTDEKEQSPSKPPIPKVEHTIPDETSLPIKHNPTVESPVTQEPNVQEETPEELVPDGSVAIESITIRETSDLSLCIGKTKEQRHSLSISCSEQSTSVLSTDCIHTLESLEPMKRNNTSFEESPLMKRKSSPQETQSDSSSPKKKSKIVGPLCLCGLCKMTFIEPTTLQCGDTFCKWCLQEWLRYTNPFSVGDMLAPKRGQVTTWKCPTCTQLITGPSMNNRPLDKIVSALCSLNEEERKNREERYKEIETMRREQLEAFYERFKRVTSTGVPMLHITEKWQSPITQSNTLTTAIRTHFGKCRQAFCTISGLTPNLIRSCDNSTIELICNRLQLQMPGKCTADPSRYVTDFVKSREMLLDFYYCDDNLFFR